MDLYEIEDIQKFLQAAYELGDEQQDENGKKISMGISKEEMSAHGLFNDAAIYCNILFNIN